MYEFKFHHITILVDNFEQAVKNFTSLGFLVHEIQPPNRMNDLKMAIIPFADGSYIELLCVKNPKMTTILKAGNWVPYIIDAVSWFKGMNDLEKLYYQHISSGPGFLFCALQPTNIREYVKDANDKGFAFGGPFQTTVQYQKNENTLEVASPATLDLPILVSEVTEHSHHFSDVMNCVHSNGVIGVKDIMIAVSNLDASLSRYSALLGYEHRKKVTEEETVEDLGKISSAVFEIDKKTKTTLTLVSPCEANGLLFDEMWWRGEAPFRLQLITNKTEAVANSLDRELTCGAFIQIVCDSDIAKVKTQIPKISKLNVIESV